MLNRSFIAKVLAISVASWIGVEAISQSEASKSAITILAASEVKWQQLNPLRGDKSPKAATLWGHRTGPGPAGFLLKPVDGFSSPPHIHNVAYRGVVIRGLLHNDDPKAEHMWMPTGSFWTQPAGGIHITAAKGNDILAYVEVEDGFGVLPAKEAFDSKERPVNVDVTNIVWQDATTVAWLHDAGTAKLAFLWGTPAKDSLNGTLLKLPAKFSGKIRSQGQSLRAVVIQGRLKHQSVGGNILPPGSTFASEGKTVHSVSCAGGVECLIYIRAKGMFDVSS
ncbi:MAG: hypothetical protein CMM48_00770 [Rhodospirillaceae bacterium]|nr:hypothetical protein [Rhodospirillaceae bacterium]